MKIKIIYCNIMSDHIFAQPEPTSFEIVEVDNWKELDKYVEKKKDFYGYNFKKDKKFGFRYISKAGGVQVEKYKEPEIKKI